MTVQTDTKWKMAFRNTTDETIPAYGLIAIAPTNSWWSVFGLGFGLWPFTSFPATSVDDDAMFENVNQEAIDGQAIWQGRKVSRSTSRAEGLSQLFFVNSNSLAVNGPSPVKPGGIGNCTQDWPAQVLHDSSETGLRPGEPCGPPGDSWFVTGGRSGFTCIAHDATRAAGTDDVHTVWISPRENPDSPGTRAQFFGVNQTELLPGEAILLKNITPGLGSGWFGLGYYFRRFFGTYLIGFNAMVSSPDMPVGETMSLTLGYLDPDTGIVDRFTVISAQRRQPEFVSVVSAENLASSGFAPIDDDLQLGVINTSDYTLEVTRCNAWMTWLGATFVTESEDSENL